MKREGLLAVDVKDRAKYMYVISPSAMTVTALLKVTKI